MFDRPIPASDPAASPNTFELYLRPRGLTAGQAPAVPDQITGQLSRAGTTLRRGAGWVSGGLMRVWYEVTPGAAESEAARRAIVLPFIAQAAGALGPNAVFEIVAPPSAIPWPWIAGGAAAVAGLVWFGMQARRAS